MQKVYEKSWVAKLRYDFQETWGGNFLFLWKLSCVRCFFWKLSYKRMFLLKQKRGRMLCWEHIHGVCIEAAWEKGTWCFAGRLRESVMFGPKHNTTQHLSITQQTVDVAQALVCLATIWWSSLDFADSSLCWWCCGVGLPYVLSWSSFVMTS